MIPYDRARRRGDPAPLGRRRFARHEGSVQARREVVHRGAGRESCNDLAKQANCASVRGASHLTTTTVTPEFATTPAETLPRRSLPDAPRPRVPITMRSAPSFFAVSATALAGGPVARTTVPPRDGHAGALRLTRD